jgi:hypothetical protein
MHDTGSKDRSNLHGAGFLRESTHPSSSLSSWKDLVGELEKPILNVTTVRQPCPFRKSKACGRFQLSGYLNQIYPFRRQGISCPAPAIARGETGLFGKMQVYW